MQRPVWGYLSTERRIPAGCRPASANDAHIVNVPCPNHDFLDYEDAHDFNHVNHVNHVNHGSDKGMTLRHHSLFLTFVSGYF
jgi:hypothetical protein